MMKSPLVRCLILLGWLATSLSTAAPTFAEDAEYRIKLAKAVRNAATTVLPSIVTIEIIGAAGQAQGEVEQDAPTSGVIVDADGYVLASSIVVRRPAASVLVVLPDNSRHPATVVAKDNHRDLVLLKIKTEKKLEPVEFPTSFETPVGSTTIAVGRYGEDISPLVSVGVLSAIGRLDGIAIQTDARVSPSFYGGPLIDLHGHFLGVLIPAVLPGGAPDATSWYDSGIAFAIPTDVIRKKLDRLREGEDIDKGLIGIVPKSSDPYENSTELAAVRTRSPAERAGLKPGDVVKKLGGNEVRRFQEIRQVLGAYDAGETIEIEYERDGKPSKIEIELAKTIPPLRPQRLGIIASEQSVATDVEDAPENKDEAEKEDDADNENAEDKDDQQEGDDTDDSAAQNIVVVDAVVPAQSVDGFIEPGDVLVNVDGIEIKDLESLRKQMISSEPDREIKIVIRRGEKEMDVTAAPKSIAGEVSLLIPDQWEPDDKQAEWKAKELKLPEVSNAAAYVAPKADESPDSLGLLVLLMNPGQDKPKEFVQKWAESARSAGVVVCAIAPEAKERWKPKEAETVGRFASSLVKKLPINPNAVAVATSGVLQNGKASASDSMALAVAVSESKTFFGVAIHHQSRPPAVRLKENEPSASMQLLLPILNKDDYPNWAAAVEKAGYPIVLGGGAMERGDLLKWVRLLQAI